DRARRDELDPGRRYRQSAVERAADLRGRYDAGAGSSGRTVVLGSARPLAARSGSSSDCLTTATVTFACDHRSVRPVTDIGERGTLYVWPHRGTDMPRFTPPSAYAKALRERGAAVLEASP